MKMHEVAPVEIRPCVFRYHSLLVHFTKLPLPLLNQEMALSGCGRLEFRAGRETRLVCKPKCETNKYLGWFEAIAGFFPMSHWQKNIFES